MFKSYEVMYNQERKRRVLIVDDEAINRDLLRLVLEKEYEVIVTSDGESALELVEQYEGAFSLILLDLLMPGMHGFEVIERLRKNEISRRIPIIVLTADSEAEVESLKLGAVDFITKPYPEREIILARVKRTIELSEDTEIIQSTERDTITGLYNREYFYRYCREFDTHHKDTRMDAILLDVHHFRMFNERYGKGFGDDVLRRIGEKVQEIVRGFGGIACRRAADTFLIYCPHREEYQELLDRVSIDTPGSAGSGRVRLRMGVYADVDKKIDLERRFDRAKMAADTVRNHYMSSYALYDKTLYEREIYTERLLEDFQTAIDQHQFTVYYQPKFDIRPDIPVLASAEALVRWVHPELGFISPGQFIPLFEENGLIQRLDLYVWREAASMLADWKKRLGICVPVSVNVSRIDMYDPNLVETFRELLAEFHLTPDELLLEITESAYTRDSRQIISKVNHLRDLGFRIEMDDFGSGYSSLNMISKLPIDALKMDMIFIRNAFQDGGNMRLIEMIIDIAEYLSVPVIAEGVETEEQMKTLKAMGCDLVQGYYFSKPVPADEYEAFLEEKKSRLPESAGAVKDDRTIDEWIEQELRPDKRAMPAAIARALTGGYEVIYYIDARSGRYVEFSAKGKSGELQIARSGEDFFGDTRRNIRKLIHPEDCERAAACLEKETLMNRVTKDGSFTMIYRLMSGGRPAYYILRAVRAYSRDANHMVIGVSRVQEYIR